MRPNKRGPIHSIVDKQAACRSADRKHEFHTSLQNCHRSNRTAATDSDLASLYARKRLTVA